MRKIKIKKSFNLIYLVLFILLCLGSVYDYQISVSLYNSENIFGIIMGMIAGYPTGIAAIFSGVLFFKASFNETNIKKLLLLLLSIFVIGLGTLSNFLEFEDNSNLSKVLLWGICLLSTIIVIWIGFKFVDNLNRLSLLKVAAVLIIVAIGNTLIVNIVKIPWSRPRMRLIQLYSELNYQPWWQVGNYLREKSILLGVHPNEFKSMPSGHTSNSAVAILLPVLSQVISSLKGKEIQLLWIGLIWTILSALSRIIIGAHFVSDTVIGCFITISLIQLVTFIFFRKEETL